MQYTNALHEATVTENALCNKVHITCITQFCQQLLQRKNGQITRMREECSSIGDRNYTYVQQASSLLMITDMYTNMLICLSSNKLAQI